MPTLSLTSTALGGITTPISLIRRPVPGEAASNPGEFSQQYFSQVALRILLDDYKTPGRPSSGCAGSDMMSLDGIDTSANPVDLNSYAGFPHRHVRSRKRQRLYRHRRVLGHEGTARSPAASRLSTRTKQEYSTTVTTTILGLGVRGRNINPKQKLNWAR